MSITLTPELATAVIQEAQKDKIGEGPIYPGTMPDSPDKRVEVATQLLGFAIDAYVNENIQGSEVTDILRAGAVTIGDDGTVSQNGNGASPEPSPPLNRGAGNGALVTVVKDGDTLEVPEEAVAALELAGYERYVEPEPDPEPEPVAEEPAELIVEISGQKVKLPREQAKQLVAAGTATLVGDDPVPVIADDGQPLDEPQVDEQETTDAPLEDGNPYAGQTLEIPWPTYDEEKDVDIRAKMHAMDDGEIAYIKAYEAANKNRKRIREFTPDPKKRKAALEAKGEAEGDPQELEVAQEAEQAAERDTSGEEPLERSSWGDEQPVVDLPPEDKLPHAEFEPAEDHPGMPILSAWDERELALAEVRKANLPIPPDRVENSPEFPEDIAAIGDSELASLHSKFAACLANVSWRLGLVTVDERAFKHIADRTARDARGDVDPINPTTGKPKGRELLDREAEDDERVIAWRERQFNAELRAIPLRKLVEIYGSYVDVLSRQWTIRSKEQDASGTLGGSRTA